MNKRMVFSLSGKMIMIEAMLMLPALITCFIYGGEKEMRAANAFIITILASLLLGLAISLIMKPKNRVIYAKEGFVMTALCWVAVSAIGAVPFVLGGAIPSYIDAFFETVSGFTTTGSSILTGDALDEMSRGLMFWRSFTHWVGGMGVIVFMMVFVPTTDRSIHIMRAEMPGPIVGKLVPKAKDTAKILYLIYIVMTAVEAVLLTAGEMNLYEALLHSFGTAGTGGFGIKPDSLGSYSAYSQWVITVFMLLFGINFNLYYLILLGRVRSIFKSEELWTYLGLFALATGTICLNIGDRFQSFSETLRHSAFQVSSIMTTTGYATTDFNIWPVFSKSFILILMFIGACAGSTAGGLKVSRVVILFKSTKGNLRRMLRPHSVTSCRFEGKRLDDKTVNGVYTYLSIYFALIFVIFLLISIFGCYDIETNFSAAVSCFNNIGPAFGGAAANFGGYDPFSKIVLSAAMLLGRLEIYPLLFMLSPYTWLKK